MSTDLIRQLERYGDHLDSVLHTLETEGAVMTVTTDETTRSSSATHSRRTRAWAVAGAAFVITVAAIGGIALVVARSDRGPVAPAGEPGTIVQYGSPQGVADGCAQRFAVSGDALWIGGLCGLARFDGVSWNAAADLPEPDGVSDIAVAPDGSLWIGRTAAGVASFDGATVTEHGLVAPLVAVTADGTVWARAMEAQKLMRYDGQWQEVFEAGAVGEIVIGGDGALWVDADEAAEPDAPLRNYVLRRLDGTWTTYPIPDHIEGGNMTPAPGGVALYGDGHVAVFDGIEWRQTMVPSLRDLGITAILLDDEGPIDSLEVTDGAVGPNGDLWMASSFYGALRFNGTDWTHYSMEDGLASDRLTFVAVGPDGSVWFGSSDAGLSRLLPDR